MTKRRYFSGAAHYFLGEYEERFVLQERGSKDPLAMQRLELKEALNEIMTRLSDADLKIRILLSAREQYEAAKVVIGLAEASLEDSFVSDAIAKNLLEVAEVLSELLSRLRGRIPSTWCRLFKRPQKLLKREEQAFRDRYEQARHILFPVVEGQVEEEIRHGHFCTLADRLEKNSEQLEAFRDKVIAHKYDPKRFVTHFSIDQYFATMEEVQSVLASLYIVGALAYDGWPRTRSEMEVNRASKWLIDGLVATAVHTRGLPPCEDNKKGL
jgi:hypothetical protein